MKNNLISEFYKSYSHKFEPHRVDIIDNYLDGELTILDDTVGGFVYLNENNLPIDILNLNLIIDNLEKNIIKIQNINIEDYKKLSFHFNILLYICLMIKNRKPNK